jgi:NAD-dependent SIR2 family protein deacetylase
MLLDLVDSKNNNYFIFTSNVDGQFQKAGFDEEKIYEVHGSIHHLQCNKNCTDTIWHNKEEIEVDQTKILAKNLLSCPLCNALARPNILMFGDWKWVSKRSDAQMIKYTQWLQKALTQKLIIIELGAGTAVPTVRMQGEQIISKASNAKLIRINPRESDISYDNGVGVDKGALDGLQSILGENNV